ncbi:MAG: DUF4105 domain-containing protein [Pseudomonadota bacterium]|nr:DUF4105 domain-containing protein [Pseudomonadota bacterium]
MLCTLNFVALATPRIGVMTMQPGEIFWERFGHNAIVVDDPQRGAPTSYNFGFFDLAEPGFISRFIDGEMEYALVALPVEQDLLLYRDEGRGVTLQWLNVTPTQAEAIAAALEENAKPENARYRYDYFTANCSTRVRDVLDRGLGGTLKPQLLASSHGNSFHSEAVRLVRPAFWMWLGFDLGLGPNADQPMTRWDEAYVPMRLADSLRQSKASDGTPLVLSEQAVLPHRIAPEPADAPRAWWPYALAGLLIGIAIIGIGRCRQRWLARLAIPLWLICGIVGCLSLYIWGFTAHWAGWRNENMLLFNPLCLLLLPGAVAIARGRRPGAWFSRVLGVVAICAFVAVILKWLPLLPQHNQPWIALLMPIHVALAWVFQKTLGLEGTPLRRDEASPVTPDRA